MVLGDEVAEHFETFLRFQRDSHTSGLQFTVDGGNDRLQSADALAEQLSLCPQLVLPIGVAVEQRGDLVQRKTELAVEQQLLQPLEVVGVVSPITGLGPGAGSQQPDLVVVMKGPHRHVRHRRDLSDRVAHRCAPDISMAPHAA